MKTFYGTIRHILEHCERSAVRSRREIAGITNEFQRGRLYGRAEAYDAVCSTIRDVLAHDLYISLFDDVEQTDYAESLKKTILRKWLRAATPAAKSEVRGEIAGALHEMICEAVPWEHELRMAILTLQSELDAIVFGDPMVDHFDITRRVNEGAKSGGASKAPLVGLAGHIAGMLYLRGALRRQMLAEWQGTFVHAQRVDDAMKAKRLMVCDDDSFTGYIAPIDKQSVKCRICGAAAGVGCVQSKTTEES
jgi:hypothetical protein